MMVQETGMHSPFLVSRRLDTRIQQFLNHGNDSRSSDLQLQSDLPTFAARLPAIKNLRLAITFQLMLESAEQCTAAELIGGRSKLTAERTTHLIPHPEACNADTQEHPQDSLSGPATHVPSCFRETPTDPIDRSKRFTCTICGLTFPFAKRLIWHMNIHGSSSPRLTRAAARKRKSEARAAPPFSACESPPAVGVLAGDVEPGSSIPSDLIPQTPFVEFQEQMKQQDALHGPAAGIDRNVDGVGSIAAKITQVSFEVALDDPNKQESPMNSSGRVDTATLLARGSNSANATRLDTRGNVIPPHIRGLHHCTQCPHSFTGKGALVNHLRSHLIKRVPVPRPPVSREWKCTDCDRLFTTRQAHTNHLRVHTKKGYPCPKCSKVYPRESDRANHLVSHEDRRAGSCVCGKKFFKLIYLENHESVCEQHRAFIQSMKVPHSQSGT
ncbi:hypothetical protein DFP73DRAFT_529885 [Morchella snyderi]|nr:hypothetical protein DFP73DRAFT_529885 [Morchella snyderi]